MNRDALDRINVVVNCAVNTRNKHKSWEMKLLILLVKLRYLLGWSVRVS